MDTPQIEGLESFEPIAQSSTSITWRAYQRALDRHVMVKMLLPEATANGEQVERFQAVSRALSRVKAQSFCQIFDISTSAECSYVIMEHAAGKTLAEHVQQNPRLPVRTVLRYALGIAEALGKAWDSERFVHRNLKPTTIHVTLEGVAKLTDYGNAFLAKPGIDIARMDDGMIIGTPNFIAPEQVDHSHPIDYRSDMYALGAILYFAFTGQIPFGDQTPDQVIHSQIEGVLPSPRSLRPDLPFSVCSLIERLLMKHPGHRYNTWNDVVGDIKRMLNGKPLRRRPLLGTGRSTLAAPLGNDGVTRTSRHTPAAADPSGPSGFARFLLWLLLMAWLALFANHRLGDPSDLYGRLRHHLPELAPYLPTLSPPPSQQVMDGPRLRVLSQPAPAPHPAAKAVSPATQPSPAPVPTVQTRATPAPETPSDDVLQRTLADAYKRQGIDGLRTQVAAQLSTDANNPYLYALRDLLATLPPLDRLVTVALQQAVGQQIDLIHNGKTRKVVPQSITDGNVSLFFAEQKRTIVLPITNINDSEKIRLLGTPLTPQQAAVVCLRLIEAGKRPAARPYIDAAGPLAPVLTLLINE